jgi:hypothetical protein
VYLKKKPEGKLVGQMRAFCKFRELGQGPSEVHDPRREVEATRYKPQLERECLILQPQEGRVKWERAGLVQLEPAEPALHSEPVEDLSSTDCS